MKTVQDCLNDPRLLNDPDMIGAPESIREIHAIRLKIQDETADMSTAEKIEILNKEAQDFLSQMGKPLCYDLAGRGKVEPLTSVIP